MSIFKETILTKDECLLCNFYGLCTPSSFFTAYPGVEKITLNEDCPKDKFVKEETT